MSHHPQLDADLIIRDMEAKIKALETERTMREDWITRQAATLKKKEEEVERLTTNGIHTCHDHCRRLPCVQGREIRRLRAALEKIKADPFFAFGVAERALAVCKCPIEMASFRYKGDPCPHCGDTIG